AGELTISAEKVGNDLEMKMRRPSSVCGIGSDSGDTFTASNGAAGDESVQRVDAQMAVQREEFDAIVCGVPKDDCRSVIERCVVIAECVDHAVKRRADRTPRLHKQIDAEMNGPPFESVVRFRREQWTRI